MDEIVLEGKGFNDMVISKLKNGNIRIRIDNYDLDSCSNSIDFDKKQCRELAKLLMELSAE